MRVPGRAATSPQDLTPDPGRQDHTILPYADRTGRVRETFRSWLSALQNSSRRCHRRPPPPRPRSWRSRYAPLPWAGLRDTYALSEFR